MPWFDPQPEPKPEEEDGTPANPFRFWDRVLGLAAGGARTRSWKIPGAYGPRPSTGDLGSELEAMRERVAGLEAAKGRVSAQSEPHEEFYANLADVGIAGFNLLANPRASTAPAPAPVPPPPAPQPERFAPPAPSGGGALGLTTLIGDRETPTPQPEGFAAPEGRAPEAKPPEAKSPAPGYLAGRFDALGAMAKAPTTAPAKSAASAPPADALAPAPQPEGFAAPETPAPEGPAPEPEAAWPYLWMLRVDRGVRGLGDDLRRRWSSKPVTAAEADNPNAAANSVGARAENELRVVAGAYRPLVPPSARAAYDRTTDEVAASVNKASSDAFRARARAAHVEGARATFDATREQLAAAHDEAVRDGDHPRAETLAGQIADLDRFRRAYRRAQDAAKPAPDTAAKPEESPAPIDAPPAPSEAPVPASTEPEKKDAPALAQSASTEPAPGHDPGALMPGGSPIVPARTEPPSTPPADPSIPPRPPGAPMSEEERLALDRKMADEAMELRRAHRRGEIESLPDALAELALRYGHLPGWLADELRIRMMSTDNGTSLEQRAEAARAIVRLAEAMPEAFAGEFADLPNVLLFAKTYLAAYERPEFATNPGGTLAQALKDADLSDLPAGLVVATIFGVMGGGRGRRGGGPPAILAATRRGKRPTGPPTRAELAEVDKLAQQAKAVESKAKAQFREGSNLKPPSPEKAVEYNRELTANSEALGKIIGRSEGLTASFGSHKRMVSRNPELRDEPSHASSMPGVMAYQLRLGRDTTFVRVGRHPKDGSGYWLMRVEDFRAIMRLPNATQVFKDRYALKYPPEYYSMARLPAGTRIQTSIANGDKEFGPGGAIQIELLKELNKAWFKRPVPVPGGNP